MNKFLTVSTLVLAMSLTVVAEAKSKASGPKAQAKKECLEGNPNLSGRELQKCIKKNLKK